VKKHTGEKQRRKPPVGYKSRDHVPKLAMPTVIRLLTLRKRHSTKRKLTDSHAAADAAGTARAEEDTGMGVPNCIT
jgi:hypothetical protein